MALPATYTKVTMHFQSNIDLARAHCVLWYLITAGATVPTLATVSAFASSFKTAFSTALVGALANGCNLTGVTLKYVVDGNEVEGDNTNGTVDGIISGDYLPEEDVLCIQKRTGLVGRSKRGRIFFPFVPEIHQENGDLNAAGLAAAAGLATMVKSNVVHSSTTFGPHHLDNKNSLLIPIVQTGYVTTICSRRDRRNPKTLTSVRI